MHIKFSIIIIVIYVVYEIGHQRNNIESIDVFLYPKES